MEAVAEVQAAEVLVKTILLEAHLQQIKVAVEVAEVILMLQAEEAVEARVMLAPHLLRQGIMVEMVEMV
jgi:hypothetical protein